MEKYTGKSIFKGIAIGKILFYQKGEQPVKRMKIEDTAEQIKRYEDARAKAAEQLQGLYEKALKEVGEANAAVFEVHQMMLEDDDYIDSVVNIIETQQVNAEFAVATTGDNFAKMFAEMEDDYFKARAADVKDISERMVNILSGNESGGAIGDEPVIVVAEDLAPSETVQMDKEKLLAFVTRLGSANSHTAILARTMNIPALIEVDIKEEWNGKMAVVDGYTGTFYIDPDEETLKKMQEKKEEDIKARELLQELKGKEDVTVDGKHIKLYANIGGVKDVASVLANDAAGIGLFRSEFLYLESETYPTEEEQFEVYKRAAVICKNKVLTIRTLDIGGDKDIPYMGLTKESNPFLGYRAIRFCLGRIDVFTTQLRAILRASAYGNIRIMLPLITGVSEVRNVRTILQNVMRELDSKEIPYDKDILLGVMIETPAACMLADILAKEADFFSIGTNDLTQYTIAVDRGNENVAYLYSAFHPAVLRSVKRIIECAKRENIEVGMCGEAAGNPAMIPLLLAFGLDEFSVTASKVLETRKNIASWTMKEAAAVTDTVMGMSTEKEVSAYLSDYIATKMSNGK